jgi:hypothetical protein
MSNVCQPHLTARLPCPTSAGVPPNNATTYCPENGTSCFFAMPSSSVDFSQARTTCSAVKGYVISYGDAEEQLAVEQYFTVRGM